MKHDEPIPLSQSQLLFVLDECLQVVGRHRVEDVTQLVEVCVPVLTAPIFSALKDSVQVVLDSVLLLKLTLLNFERECDADAVLITYVSNSLYNCQLRSGTIFGQHLHVR